MDENDLEKTLKSGEYIPPNIRISKVSGGSLVWVMDEIKGHALSVAFVPDALNYSQFNAGEPAEPPKGDLHLFSGSSHVHVHNPTSYQGNRRIPLEVWVVNK